MAPDEIQKDREAGTPETHEPDYKAAMLYHSDRADAYMSERDALTAENAALKERVGELEAALHAIIYTDHHRHYDGPPPRYVEIARSAVGGE